MSNLGFGHKMRFDRFKDITDLNMSIECLREAVSLTPEEHPDLAGRLCNLGDAYTCQPVSESQVSDLERAIECFSRSVELTPNDHPSKPMRLTGLADAYERLYQHSQSLDHIHASLDYLQQAAQSRFGPPRIKLSAARIWAMLSLLHKTSSPLEGYQRVIDLIPEFIWLGINPIKRYEDIPYISDIVIEAVHVAITYKKPEIALEWLESGRFIVWTQLLELRTPHDQLAQIDESLAERLRNVSESLDFFSHDQSMHPDTSSSMRDPEEAAQRYRRLAEEREQLIERAKQLPGMGEFFQAKKSSDLVTAARTGAVVVINVHRRGCHALVISPHNTAVSTLHLQNFTHEKAANARKQLNDSLQNQGRTARGVRRASKGKDLFANILHMQWTDLAEPVLEFLEYTTIQYGDLPHITWCTTGPLSLLPLHAAGDYSKPGHSLFDFAVSSFTPTLSALLSPPATVAQFSGILMIGQALTPGRTPLQFTSLELDRISDQFGDLHMTRLEGEAATTVATLAALREHSWAHFACHASQNLKEPTSSAIYLHDGVLDLAAITQQRLINADLAFLSACQTATGDEMLSEEWVHLSAGMVVAGFKRVLATMWSIDDEDAPLVAGRFYAYMLDDKMLDHREAAKALHFAVSCLREKAGVRAFERWAPYIHIGL